MRESRSLHEIFDIDWMRPVKMNSSVNRMISAVKLGSTAMVPSDDSHRDFLRNSALK